MRGTLTAAILILAATPAIALPAGLAQAESASAAARATIAQALYTAAATRTAADKSRDADLIALRGQIEALTAENGHVRAQLANLTVPDPAALAALQEKYVAALAQRDRAYAQEIAVLRGAVTDIAKIPEGAAALARFNAGDEIGALAVLDRLRAANDSARVVRSNIESAAEARRIAVLALDARARGKVDLASVIARYEAVVKLDPGVFWDHQQLSRLYVAANRLADSQVEAQAAKNRAVSQYEQHTALIQLGDIARSRNDLKGATETFVASFELIQADLDKMSTDKQALLLIPMATLSLDRMATMLSVAGSYADATEARRMQVNLNRVLADERPDNRYFANNLAAALGGLGSAQRDGGDYAGAVVSYREGVAVARKLVAADASTSNQRRLANLLASLSRLRPPALPLDEARRAAEEGLAIRQQLAARDPGDTIVARDVNSSRENLGYVLMAAEDPAGAIAQFEQGEASNRQLLAGDKSNVGLALDLDLASEDIADALKALGDTPGAIARYTQVQASFERLAATTEGDVRMQRNISRIMRKRAELPGGGVAWAAVKAKYEALDAAKQLAPADRYYLNQARTNAAKAAAAPR